MLLGEGGGGLQGGEVDLFGDPGGEGAGVGVVEGQAQGEEDVLQAHDAEADGAPAGVGGGGLGGGVVVDVDDAVEEGDGGVYGGAEFRPVDGVACGGEVGGEVDRAEVAHRGLGVAGDFDDLGAQVREVYGVAGASGLVA